MNEQEMDQGSKKRLMQELETAANGNCEEIALWAKSALERQSSRPWASILNYGLMKMTQGQKMEQENCQSVFELILFGLFFPDQLLPVFSGGKAMSWQDAIKDHYNHVTDAKAKKNIDDFIRGIELIGRQLQASEKLNENYQRLLALIENQNETQQLKNQLAGALLYKELLECKNENQQLNNQVEE